MIFRGYTKLYGFITRVILGSTKTLTFLRNLRQQYSIMASSFIFIFETDLSFQIPIHSDDIFFLEITVSAKDQQGPSRLNRPNDENPSVFLVFSAAIRLIKL